jgi:GT2 family glycosyltransferase
MNTSIMITTRNRLSDLQRTLAVLTQLDPAPLEILVTADGCTDGTAEFVREKYPLAKLIVNAVGQGSVASRDRMMRQALGDLVFSLDDDSYPEQMNCLKSVAELFRQRPQLAVAHFPQHSDEHPESLTRTDFGPPCFTRSFANSGACLRRSTYLELPGFELRFFHAFEEPDYALQCVAAHQEVYYVPIITIRHHFSSLSRSRIRTHHRHARNQVWSILMRCPFPYSAVLIVCKTFSQFGFAARQGISWIVREPVWWWQALVGIPYCLSHAKPVSWENYKRWFHSSRRA